MENVFNETNFHFLLDGLYLTLMVAVATCVISIILGTFLAITRNYGGRIARTLAAIYIETFRNTPLLLWMLTAVFILPSFFGRADPAVWGTIGFSLYTSSVMAEIIRGGLNSIILPQTFRKVIPSLLSQIITTFKDTSFLAGLQIAELTYQSKIILAQLTSFEEILLMIGVVASIYFVVCFSLSVLVRYLDKKTAYVG